MLLAPYNLHIAVYTPAKKFVPAGFCAFRPPAGLYAPRFLQPANCSLHSCQKVCPCWVLCFLFEFAHLPEFNALCVIVPFDKLKETPTGAFESAGGAD